MHASTMSLCNGGEEAQPTATAEGKNIVVLFVFSGAVSLRESKKFVFCNVYFHFYGVYFPFWLHKPCLFNSRTVVDAF